VEGFNLINGQYCRFAALFLIGNNESGLGHKITGKVKMPIKQQ